MYLKYNTTISLLLLLILSLACDDFEQNIEIELPPTESELVVECYLEAGQAYRVLLTETKGYFDSLSSCPFVRHAIVVITHNGIKDTLQEAPYFNNNCNPDDAYGFYPYFNVDSTRFFNYGSSSICPADYNNDFMLEVWDTVNNRQINALTRFIPPVSIKTFQTSYNNEGKAYCLFGCQDDANTIDYYRMMMHKKSLTKRLDIGLFTVPIARDPQFDRVIDDGGIFGGNDVLHGTAYKYKQGDTLIGTIYHIDQAWHDYLETSRDAERANGNPFGQPATVLSNINGGRGIFTFLSYDRDTLYVP